MQRLPLIVPPAGPLGLEELLAPVVRAVVAERLDLHTMPLAGDVSFAGDLAADALDVLEVVLALEARLAIYVPEGEIDRVQTLDDLVRTVARRVACRDRPTPAPTGKEAASVAA